MEKDDLMEDSSLESENEDRSNKLSSIFNDPYVTTYHTADGKRRWRCEWCKKDFALWNATKALYHLIQKKKVDIAPCHAKIDQESMKQYMDRENWLQKVLKQTTYEEQSHLNPPNARNRRRP